MIRTDHEEHEADHEGEPSRGGTNDHGHDRNAHEDTRDPVCLFPKECIGDVPSIELSDGHHVQSGDKQSDPAGHEKGIQLRVSRHLTGVISLRLDGIHDPLHSERRIELVGA
jgi:hypothetical protein